MRLRLEAGEGELEEKALSVVRRVASALAKYDSRLSLVAKALWKADLNVVGEVDFQGLKIAIENPVGSTRHWKDERTGAEGTTVMQNPYGFIQGTRGADGDGYDCFLGPDPDAPFVWIVHQARPDLGNTQSDGRALYDEDKVMLGFSDVHEATGAYRVHYDRPEFFGSMTQMTIAEFKAKVLATTDPGEDGMVKSEKLAEKHGVKLIVSADAELAKSGLLPALTADRAPGMGMRAVHTGVSGPNIAMDAPARTIAPTDTTIDPMSATSMRSALEASVATRDEDRESAPRRDPSVYSPASITELPIRPVAEWEQRMAAGEEARKDAPENLRYVQDQLDRRSWFVREGHPERLLPRDERMKERFFIPAPPAETKAQEAALKSRDDDIKTQDLPAPRLPPEEPAKPEYKVTRTITVEKAELGIVGLSLLKSEALLEPRFEVRILGRIPRVFTSLSAACDHVWVVQKGFRDVKHWRTETGRRKVPSGAGWRFWGVDPARVDDFGSEVVS